MSLSPNSILVVDDEQRLRDLVRSYLEHEGFAVRTAGDGVTALDLARQHAPDLVVLDLMLPGLDGLEVCRRLRTFSDAYVMIARVRAMLRRPRHSGATPLPDVPPSQRFGDLLIDHGRREVTLAGIVLPLTTLEFALLTTLAAHPGMVFTRAQLLERVWDTDYFGDDHVVDVHVANLRKKLNEDPAAPRYIETVRGAGYRFAGRVG